MKDYAVWLTVGGTIGIAVVILLLMTQQKLQRLKQSFIQQEKTLLKIVESLDGKNSLYEKQLQREWRSFIYLQCLEVIDGIRKQKESLHPRAIEQATRQQTLPREQLAQIYDPKQLQQLHDFWQTYDEYVKTYWETDKGKIKTVFTQKDMDRLKQASVLAEKELQQLLIELM